MEYKIEKLSSFKIIGYKKDFLADQAFTQIPEFFNKTMRTINKKHILGIGIYSVTINDEADFNLIHYYVAGPYDHDIPNLATYEFPDSAWVKFPCEGPYPYALQQLNYQIYNSWFPAHPQYTLAFDASVEFLTNGNRKDSHYYSELWLPIKKDNAH